MYKRNTLLLPCNDDSGGSISVYKTDYEKFKKSRKIVITKEVINREGVHLEYYLKNLDLIEGR